MTETIPAAIPVEELAAPLPAVDDEVEVMTPTVRTARTEYSRYACTLGKAVAMVTPRSKGSATPRREIKGCWKVGQTRDRILGSIIETPMSPKQIAEYTNIVLATVYVVLGRISRDGKVIRDHHTYPTLSHGVYVGPRRMSPAHYS